MRVLLVVKRSRLETADDRAKKLLRKHDPATGGWKAAHDAHSRTVDVVTDMLAKAGVRHDVVGDPYRPFWADDAGLVLVVGGDGTFLAASHSVNRTVPMLGVNSDPSTSRGFFCAADAESFGATVGEAMEGRAPRAELLRMGVSVNGEVRSKRVLNEALLCHPHPAATTKFSVNFSDSELEGWESHVSSGAWIGPPAGTTGAMRSAGGDVLPLGSKLLQFVSREPISGMSRKVVSQYWISARVKNDEAAVYMDGPYKYATLVLGDVVRFFPSDEPLIVLGLDGRR